MTATAIAKERPIIFSADSVRAILDGRKTQTRRIVKPQPHPSCAEDGVGWHWHSRNRGDEYYWNLSPEALARQMARSRTPYGRRLWVREAFCDNGGNEYEYKATSYSHAGSWSSPLHMPRRASRITLEIVSVRVERLQDIDPARVEYGEGVALNHYYCDESGGAFGHRCEPIERFKELWDGINGKKASWESNPFVWVIEFRRCA